MLSLLVPLALLSVDLPRIQVDAGDHDRSTTPIRLDLPRDQATDLLSTALVARVPNTSGPALPVQVDPISDDAVRLTFLLPCRIPAGSSQTLELEPALTPSPWRFDRTEARLQLLLRDRPFFVYNTQPVTHPDFPSPYQARDAYIHPAFSPLGAQVTGDYSAHSHPHHRGFFLAYTKTNIGDLHPDFWNLQSGSGRVRFDHLGDVQAGPVTARFRTHHDWEAAGEGAERVLVLKETWDVEAIDIPGADYRLFEITSTQRAVGRPIELPPYRYGGMAYRGPDPFLPAGVLDVLTSEGFDRVQGDQKPTRWVDLTGPITDGSSTYAGAAILDAPTNQHHPTPARIHPSRIPFFCFVPSHDTAVTIPTDRDLVFHYRVVLHDGHPDPERNNRLWNDFGHPPVARLLPAD